MSGIRGATTCLKSEICRKICLQIVPDESQENDAVNDEYSPSLAPDPQQPVPPDEQPEGEASHPPTVGSGETTPTAESDNDDKPP